MPLLPLCIFVKMAIDFCCVPTARALRICTEAEIVTDFNFNCLHFRVPCPKMSTLNTSPLADPTGSPRPCFIRFHTFFKDTELMLSSTGNTGSALIPGIHINCEECHASFRRIRISPVADPGFHVNREPTIQEGVPMLYSVQKSREIKEILVYRGTHEIRY